MDSAHHPRRATPGLVTMRLSDLPAPAARRPRRMTSHMLVLVTAGRATFAVDFEVYPCRPGGLLWMRPGQVVTFPPPRLDATLVLFEHDFLPEGAVPTVRPESVYWQPAGEDEEAIVDSVSQLEIDLGRLGAGETIPLELLQHELAALLLRVSLLPSTKEPAESASAEVFDRFRREIEARFTATHQVDDYATALGCSVRTLTRASLATTGRTAKQLIDDRVALEAKRLLAHSDLPVSAIARRLGFGEPTNFGRFFARTCGQSPGRFRASVRL